MTQADELPVEHRDAIRGDFRRKVMVFFIYLIFGPPIGGIITLTSMLGYVVIEEGFGQTFSNEWFSGFPLFPFYILFLSLWGYLFGGVQAALTGLILSISSDAGGRFGYFHALLATIPPSILAGIFLYFQERDGFVASGVLAIVSVVASLVVRFLFRNRFRPQKLA